MSQQQRPDWSARDVVTALAGALHGVGALFLLLLSLATLGSSNEDAYCENIDHPTPCSRIVEMSLDGILLWLGAALALVLAGAVVLAVGWRLWARRRGWTGAALVLCSFSGPVAAYTIVLGYLNG